VHTDIRAVIISEDAVSSAVLARSLKEWWCAGVTCNVYPTVASAMRTQFIDTAEIVFISAFEDELELHRAIRAIHARALSPICIVISNLHGAAARAAALRAGAHDCISGYVANQDDIHRCLWSVLRKRTAEHLSLVVAVPQLASA